MFNSGVIGVKSATFRVLTMLCVLVPVVFAMSLSATYISSGASAKPLPEKPSPSPATNTMIKVVTKDISPDVPTNSFGALPKTLYKIGEGYARIEELPDPDAKSHMLMVVNEPKVWTINLSKKIGILTLDPGPTYEFHVPIIPPKGNETPPLFEFEFGSEYEFLHAKKATKSKVVLNGKEYDRLVAIVHFYYISLLSLPGTEQPYRVRVMQGSTVLCEYEYLEYSKGLAPNMRLFEPPPDVNIVENGTKGKHK